jgi:hypothetical protein
MNAVGYSEALLNKIDEQGKKNSHLIATIRLGCNH